jgi:hypothetical protein
MLFICTTSWDPGHANDAIKKRLEMEKTGDVVPPGVKVVGEWGYIGGGKAFFLAAVDDPSAFMGMCMGWSGVMSMEVVPVLERKDIAKLRSKMK